MIMHIFKQSKLWYMLTDKWSEVCPVIFFLQYEIDIPYYQKFRPWSMRYTIVLFTDVDLFHTNDIPQWEMFESSLPL